LKELKDEDPVAYRNILRLGGAQFDALLQMDGWNDQETRHQNENGNPDCHKTINNTTVLSNW
jgi:hypothetical protein